MLFVNMIKLQSLKHFPANHISHPILSSVSIPLSSFAVFAYNTIN